MDKLANIRSPSFAILLKFASLTGVTICASASIGQSPRSSAQSTRLATPEWCRTRVSWAISRCEEKTEAEVRAITKLPLRPVGDGPLQAEDLRYLTGLVETVLFLEDVTSLDPELFKYTPGIKKLDIRFSKRISSLPAGFLDSLVSLESLELNDVVDLPKELLRHNGKLKNLKINLPPLERAPEIPAGMLASAHELEDFRLSDPAILSEDLFAASPLLARVYIDVNSEKIPSNLFVNNHQLESVVLRGGMDKMPVDFFGNQPFLKTLELSVVRGEWPPGLFAGCSALKTLVLSAGLGSFSPGLFQGASALESLSANFVSGDLHSEVFLGLESLRELYFSMEGDSNVIALDVFHGLRELQTLDLYANFQELPERLLANLPKLRTVTLRSTNLKNVAASLLENSSQVSELKIISLYTHAVVPWDVTSGLTNLERLEFGRLGLEGDPLPYVIDHPKLRKINLCGNRFSSVAADLFDSFVDLEWVDLSYNALPPDQVDALVAKLGSKLSLKSSCSF